MRRASGIKLPVQARERVGNLMAGDFSSAWRLAIGSGLYLYLHLHASAGQIRRPLATEFRLCLVLPHMMPTKTSTGPKRGGAS
jgi:hypothetical protein